MIRINNVKILIPLVLFIGILVGAGYEYYSSGNFQVEMMKEVNINQLMALSSIILKNGSTILSTDGFNISAYFGLNLK